MRVDVIDHINRACAERSDVLGLAGGLPDPALFPRDELSAATNVVMSDPRLSGLQYGWPEGDATLREWIAKRVSTAARPVCADEVIVTAGAQQAIALAVDALLTHGAPISTLDATYPAALELFASRGLQATDGFAADAFYVMPEIGNPAGTALDASQLARIAAADVPVLEDDAYAELRFDGTRVARNTASQAWRIGTFAKTLCPGLRIGWLVPPREARERVLQLKHDADLQTNGFGQAVLVALLDRFDYDAHLVRVRAAYAHRASALGEALRRHLPSWAFREPDGGFSFWVDTGVDGNDVAFLALASSHGVSFDPGRIFRPRKSARIALRLCYSNVREDLIDEAVKRLAHAWDAFNAGTCASARRDPNPPTTSRP